MLQTDKLHHDDEKIKAKMKLVGGAASLPPPIAAAAAYKATRLDTGCILLRLLLEVAPCMARVPAAKWAVQCQPVTNTQQNIATDRMPHLVITGAFVIQIGKRGERAPTNSFLSPSSRLPCPSSLPGDLIWPMAHCATARPPSVECHVLLGLSAAYHELVQRQPKISPSLLSVSETHPCHPYRCNLQLPTTACLSHSFIEVLLTGSLHVI